ncbi:MAG: 1-deoxy-D-xylulose-5-phosphate reductoisomerase, partial [Hyphomicrobiaceae bacterium]
TPIAYSLSWPERMPTSVERLNLAQISRLDFEPPDNDRFPALELARQALEQGTAACTVLNGANEVAVEAFLARNIGFLEIARLVAHALQGAEQAGLLVEPGDIDEVLVLDAAARQLARGLLNEYGHSST